MKTPKRLYPNARIIYHPELSTCPVCGGALMLANYVLWDKTVQTLEQVLSVASRPAHCADPECAGASLRLRSAAGQQVALPYSTYGYDVVVRIGWQRQTRCATYAEIHADLTPSIQIAESQVRRLYQQAYLPLLAGHTRQQIPLLDSAVATHGGLVIALDGLAPEGGEPQLWCMRDLLTGIVLRSGWLCRQDQTAFEGFLLPLQTLPWPIRAILSDKQRGLLPALATILPTTPHQLCQTHYLRNLAEPLAAQDSTFTVTLRQAVRQELGPLLLADQPPLPSQPGVLTMTGVLVAPPFVADAPPSVPATPAPCVATPVTSSLPDVSTTPADLPPDHDTQIAADVVTHLLRRTRYLLTLKGRPPLRLAGLETYAGLREVVARSQRLLAHRHDPHLVQLVQGLEDALEPLVPSLADLQSGANWLAGITTLLAPTPESAPTATTVAQQLQTSLDQLDQDAVSPKLEAFRQHLQKVSRS